MQHTRPGRRHGSRKESSWHVAVRAAAARSPRQMHVDSLPVTTHTHPHIHTHTHRAHVRSGDAAESARETADMRVAQHVYRHVAREGREA